MGEKSVIGQEAAETIALQALGWMLSSEETLTQFLGESGLSVAELGTSARQPEFLAAVLDFILTQDEWVLAASGALGRVPEDLVQARAALPGGAVPDWT